MFGYRGGVSETQYAGTFSPFILQGVQYPMDIKYPINIWGYIFPQQHWPMVTDMNKWTNVLLDMIW